MVSGYDQYMIFFSRDTVSCLWQITLSQANTWRTRTYTHARSSTHRFLGVVEESVRNKCGAGGRAGKRLVRWQTARCMPADNGEGQASREVLVNSGQRTS